MLTIGGVEIGGPNPCRFVAEISNNHNGDFARALRLIDAAKNIGCEFVKFQAFEVAELVLLRGDGPAPEPWGSAGWTMQTLYEKAQTPLAWLPYLFDIARRIGLVPFSSVFGPTSLDVLRACDNPAYKIARLDNQNAALWGLALAPGAPIIASANESSYYLPQVSDRDVALLYCPSGYPQRNFALSHDLFHDGSDHGDFSAPYIGFSFHGTEGTPCVVAATLGAKLIEAHLQLDDEISFLEGSVSLTASNFRDMIQRVREVEGILA